LSIIWLVTLVWADMDCTMQSGYALVGLNTMLLL
jgi:hypothetical protein